MILELGTTHGTRRRVMNSKCSALILPVVFNVLRVQFEGQGGFACFF